MSSHLDYIKCPHCGHEDALCDINSNAEEMIHCRHCGYHRRFFIANMEDHGKEDWMPQYEIYECSDPYGAYYRGEIALATVTRYVDGAITEEVLVDNPHPVV
jgi:Zn ribbon nucleic-acid-binding protein